MPVDTDRIRKFITTRYFIPARQKGEVTISIQAGEVHKAMGLQSRVPMVCSALRSHQLEDENDVSKTSEQGPPSGQSTTMVYTYKIHYKDGSSSKQRRSSLLKLKGLGKGLWDEWGGGEAFLLEERKQSGGE